MTPGYWKNHSSNPPGNQTDNWPVHSLVLGTLFGLAVGAFLAYLILLGNPGHALNIMLPGSLVGLIVGYAAQKHQS